MNMFSLSVSDVEKVSVEDISVHAVERLRYFDRITVDQRDELIRFMKERESLLTKVKDSDRLEFLKEEIEYLFHKYS